MQSVAELPFIAGHVALNFVNTAEARDLPEAGEALVTASDLRLWGQRYDLISHATGEDEGGQSELDRAREARELLYELFLDLVNGLQASEQRLAQLARLATAAYAAATLRASEGGGVVWCWDRSQLATVRHVAVASAVDLLRADPSPRLKQCPGARCGWFFLDATKRGNRRWCSMSECGQDAKDLRRRAKRRAGGDGRLARRADQ